MNIFEKIDINEENNITKEDLFNFEIDKSIETGNITFIQNAIKQYKNQIHKSYIELGNKILIQLTEEKMENIDLKNID